MRIRLKIHNLQPYVKESAAFDMTQSTNRIVRILLLAMALFMAMPANAVRTAKARVCEPINTDVWRALDTALSKTRFGNRNKYKVLSLAAFFDASTYEPLRGEDPNPPVKKDSINVNSDFYVVVYSGSMIHAMYGLEDVIAYKGMDYIVAKGVEGQLTKFKKTARIPSHEEFYEANRQRLFSEIAKEPILLKWNSNLKKFTRVSISLELGKIYWRIME